MKYYLVLVAVFGFFTAMGISHASSFVTQYCSSTGQVQIVAPWYCSDINIQAQNVWSQWEPLALIVAFLSFLLGAVIFMAGIVSKSSRIRNFGVGEIYESIASILIVVAFLFIAATLFGLLPGVVTGPINPYDTSLTYIANTINTTSSLASRLFIIASLDRYYASITTQICFLNTLVSVCTPEGFRPFAFTILLWYWPAWALMQFMLDALFTLYVQYYFILFFLYAGMPVFLIPGVILRAFLPTRGVGGMMIAIAIGFFLVMPVLFSIAYYFTSTSAIKGLSNTYATLTQYGAGTGAQAGTLSPYSPLVLAITNANSVMNGFWLSILFFPALILAITYSVVMQLAQLIGGAAKTGSTKLTALV